MDDVAEFELWLKEREANYRDKKLCLKCGGNTQSKFRNFCNPCRNENKRHTIGSIRPAKLVGIYYGHEPISEMETI